MDKAQARFKTWTKGALAPGLRKLGFTGSGQTFTLPDSECWALLGVQKSSSSTADHVKFTLNLSVVNRELWSELREWEHYWLAARPTANATGPGQTGGRIGSLLPAGIDTWWSITDRSTTTELTDLSLEVVSAVRDFGLPEFRRLVHANSTEGVASQLDAIKRIRPRPAHLK